MSKFAVVQTVRALNEMVKGLLLAIAFCVLLGLGLGLGLTFG